MKLTAREEDTLHFIEQYKEAHGYPPTIREIAEGINTKSIYHVKSMLDDMQDKGFIRYKPTLPRTIKIIKRSS